MLSTFEIILIFVVFIFLALLYTRATIAYVKAHNALVDMTTEMTYYKELFYKTLQHKRILEEFINTKITPNIENEQDR